MFHYKHAKRISIHVFPKCKSAALPLARPVWCVADEDDDDDDDISEVVTIYV